jgi:hypothetical protein
VFPRGWRGCDRGYVVSMAVFALWSAPRTRSTAFFRPMAKRGDMVVLHEPFCNLRDYGETDAGGRTFGSPLPLVAWLRSETQGLRVFAVPRRSQRPATRCTPA